MSNTICNLWSKRARSAEPREAPPGQKSGAGLRPPAVPSQGTGSEVRLGSGNKRLRQEPPPVFPLGLRFPLPFLQKSIHPDSRVVAGRTSGGAAAVRGADSLVLTAHQAAAVRRAPAPALRQTAILWSLPHPEEWTMEADFPSFLLPLGVCGSGEWTK